MLPTLEGRLVTLRPPRETDAEPLARILAEPAVRPWWGPNDLRDVRETLAERPGWTIEAADKAGGWIELTEETTPEYRSVGLDIFVATVLHGRGHAREALRLAIRHFIGEGHHRFTIDPATANERAIGAYSAVGFKPVGVLRAQECLERDGNWRDGLLMDLLADELVG